VKNLIGSILTDENIKKEGLNFVQNIISDEQFVGQILELLLSALQNKEFLNVHLLRFRVWEGLLNS